MAFWNFIKHVFTYNLNTLSFARRGQPFMAGPTSSKVFLPTMGFAYKGQPFVTYRKS